MKEYRIGYKSPAYGQVYGYGGPGEEEEIDLARLWALLVDHRWTLVAFTGAAFLLGLLYVLAATPVYRADALLQVEKEQKTLPGLSEMADMFSEASSAQTEIELIRSRMVLGEAVDRLNLDVQVIPERGFFERLVGGPATPGFGMEPGFAAWRGEKARIAFNELELPAHLVGLPLQLSVVEGNTYALTFQGRELLQGETGKRVTQDDITVAVSRLDASPGRTFIVTQRPRLEVTESLNRRLGVSEKGKDTGILTMSFTDPSPPRARVILNTIANVYRDQNLERRSAEAEKSLAFLEEQLPEIKDELTSAEEKLNEYRAKRDSVDLTLETESKLKRLVELETRLNELAIKENEIQQRFTREHPSYRTLIEQRRSLQTEKRKIEEEIEGLPETQQEILRLRRDMDVNQEIYMQLRNKAQELRVLKAGTVANVRIIDEALTSPQPVKPRKPLILALSIVLGAMLGVAWVLLRAFFNRTVQSPEELEEMGLNAYASIPVSQKQIELDRAQVEKGNRTLPLLAKEAPSDLTVEALRSLRTSLHFAMMGSFSNVVMLSGPTPGVGKSFIASNIGAILAQTEQRVVLIDADLRKGHLHRYFGTESSPGLSDHLGGTLHGPGIIKQTPQPGLDFVPRGSVPPNPAELLMHKRMRELVEHLSNNYDLVIIDTPPILAVTDAAIVGQYAGASMMVVRYGMSHLKEVEIAYKRFEQNGVKIKGAILNAMEYSRANVYGYYPYQYRSDNETDQGPQRSDPTA